MMCTGLRTTGIATGLWTRTNGIRILRDGDSGFLHMMWILRKHESSQDDFSNVKDLMADPVVRYALDNPPGTAIAGFPMYGAEYGG